MSSFCSNSQIFGIPADVRGSSVEYKYVICAKKKNEIKYVNWDEITNKYEFVSKEALATSHDFHAVFEFMHKIEEKYPNYSFKLIKRSYWSEFNDDFIPY